MSNSETTNTKLSNTRKEAGKTPVLIASFPNHRGAHAALLALHNDGFSADAIGLLCRDDEGGKHYESLRELDESHAKEGATVGAALGASGGVGWGLAIAAGILPPLGPVVAGGLFGALLVSAGFGAVTGSLVGGLLGLGIDEEQAEFAHCELEEGRSVVCVRGNLGRASELLSAHKAQLALVDVDRKRDLSRDAPNHA